MNQYQQIDVIDNYLSIIDKSIILKFESLKFYHYKRSIHLIIIIKDQQESTLQSNGKLRVQK